MHATEFAVIHVLKKSNSKLIQKLLLGETIAKEMGVYVGFLMQDQRN